MPSVINSLAEGIDPQVMEKISLDNMERLETLNFQPNASTLQPLNYNIDVTPFIPKDYGTENLVFKKGNQIDLKELLNSKDPKKNQLGADYLGYQIANSVTLNKGYTPQFYPYQEGMDRLQKHGYDFTKSVAQNEDAYAKKENQWSLWKNPFNPLFTVPRIFTSAALSLGEMAIDTGLRISNLGKDKQSFWTNVAENSLLRDFQGMSEDVKDYLFPIYKSLNYDNKGFFEKLADPEYYQREVVDLFGNFLGMMAPGMAVTKIGRSMVGLGAAGRLLNTNIPGIAGKAVKFFAGSKNAVGIGAFATSVVMESGMESLDSFNTIYDSLENEIDPTTGEAFTVEERRRRAGEAASTVFKGNAAILAFSNGLENRWIQRMFGREAVEKATRGIVVDKVLQAAEKKFSNKALNWFGKSVIGKRFLYYTPEIAESIVREGGWEENAQTAITRLMEQKFGKGSYIRKGDDGQIETSIERSGNTLTDFFRQLGVQSRDTATWFGGKGDFDVSSAIGGAAILGGFGTVVSNKIALRKEWDSATRAEKFKIFKSVRREIETERIKAISEINDAKENFLSFKDIFKADGTIDSEKLEAKKGHIKDIIEKFDLSEDIKDPIVKEQIQKSIFAEYVFAHIKNGTFGQFKEQFNKVRTPEELALMGFNEDLIADKGEYNQLADALNEQNQQIQSLRFEYKEGMHPESFDFHDKLLKSRLYELHSKTSLNQITLEKTHARMQEKYENVYNDFVLFETLTKQFDNLEEITDTDGSLATQKDIIKSQLSAVESNVTKNMTNLEAKKGLGIADDFVDDIRTWQNAVKFGTDLNKEINKLSNPKTGMDLFVSQMDEAFKDNTVSEEKEDPEEVLVGTTNTPSSSNVPVISITPVIVTKTGEEKDLEKDKKDIITDTTLSDIEKAEALKKKEDEILALNRKDEIIKSFNASKTIEELNSINDIITEEEQVENKTQYLEKLASLTPKDEVEEDIEITDEYPSSSSVFETPLKTISLDSIDLVDKDGKVDSTKEKLKDEPYNQIISEFLRVITPEKIEEYGYKFFIEMDTFNINDIEFVEIKGVQTPFSKIAAPVIVVRDSKNNLVKVSDLFEDAPEKFLNKPFVFLFGDNRFMNTAQNRATIKSKKTGQNTLQILGEYGAEVASLKIAKEAARKGESIQISITKVNKGMKPTITGGIPLKVTDHGKVTDIRLNIHGVATIVTSNGEVMGFGPKLNEATEIFDKVKETLGKTYTTKAEASERITYLLNRLFYTNRKEYFQAEENESGTFNIKAYKIVNTAKVVDTSLEDGTKRINISKKSLEGKMIWDTEVMKKKDYIRMIAPHLRTYDKIIYNSNGKTQYKGNVSGYLEFVVGDKIAVDIIEKKVEPEVKTINFGILEKNSKGEKIPISEAEYANTLIRIDKIVNDALKDDYNIVPFSVLGQAGIFFTPETVVILKPYFSNIKKNNIPSKVSDVLNQPELIEEETVEEINQIIQPILDNLEVLKEKTFIVNPKNRDTYIETNLKGKVILGTEVNRASNIQTDGSLKIETFEGSEEAVSRGNIVDHMFRNFLTEVFKTEKQLWDEYNKIKDTPEFVESLPMTKSFFKSLFEQFQSVQKSTGNLLLLGESRTLWGEINGIKVAGTVDTLAINKVTGQVYIIDTKTSKYDNRPRYADPTDEMYHQKHKNQQSVYAELFRQRTGIEVAGIFILPVQTVIVNGEYTQATLNTPATGKSTVKLEFNQIIYKKDGSVVIVDTPQSKEDADFNRAQVLRTELTSGNGRTITQMSVEEQQILNKYPLPLPDNTPNPTEEVVKNRFTQGVNVVSSGELAQRDFNIQGSPIMFDEITGDLVHREGKLIKQFVLDYIYDTYKNHPKVKIEKVIIPSKIGDYIGYVFKYPDYDPSGREILTEFLFHPRTGGNVGVFSHPQISQENYSTKTQRALKEALNLKC